MLIAWDEHAAFRSDFPNDAAIDHFFAEVGFYEWNQEQDRGRSRAEAVAAIGAKWPEHVSLLDRFFDRFSETIQQKNQRYLGGAE